MTREQLEHVIRAAAAIAAVQDIVVIGSQSILGMYPDAPEELLVSQEADVYPKEHPERGDLIDGSIGEGSPFARAFGYFAHGVDDTIAILPRGWDSRLVVVDNGNTQGARGWCLEAHDLAIAKYIAGREKDLQFTHTLARCGMTKYDVLLTRLESTKLDDELRTVVKTRIQADFQN
jgi:hypothetical protein